MSIARRAKDRALGVADRLLRQAAIRALLTVERLESGIGYNPTSPKFTADPYAVYANLRDRDPVHRTRLTNGWTLARYADVDRLLRDHRRFSNAQRNLGYTDYLTMLDMDPPDHTRLRALVSQAFTPRAVARLQPRIQQICDDLLDAAEAQGRFDLMEALAFPLPVITIAEMLGVPSEDRDRFKAWSRDVALTIEPLLSRAEIHRVRTAFEKLRQYFRDLIEQRQRRPQDDMITALLAAEEAGDRLNREELIMTLLLLLVAGHETTRNLIGNGMLALLRHPDQLQRLRAEPDLLDSAVHELLRYDSPVQFDGRIAREDVTIGGKRIRKGQRVVGLIGSANRDPEVFARPDRLDIGRRQKTHIAFGRGIHHCLGSSLALLEGRIVFASLLRRFASIQLAEEPEYAGRLVLRGLRELWVQIEPAPPVSQPSAPVAVEVG